MSVAKQDRIRALIFDSGGRGHALYQKMMESPLVDVVYVLPGNGGIIKAHRIAGVNPNTFSAVLEVIQAFNINLVVPGSEQTLVDGLGDYLAEMAPDVAFFGPSKAAAQLEGSKAYMKDLCIEFDIPTAGFAIVKNMDTARRTLQSMGVPIVVKADGLAGGKGVTVAHTVDEALKALDDCFVKSVFKDAGKTVVLESFLEGFECSFMVICDGSDADDGYEFELAQDYKRLRPGPDGPNNPNTGGMGAYSPLQLDPEVRMQIRTRILKPLLRAMRIRGCPFKGILYLGIMITKDGPMLLEVNVRFGDPEAQVLLARLLSDIVPYFLASAHGTLLGLPPLEWSTDHAVCVVMASEGYPASPKTDRVIYGLHPASKLYSANVLHAGTDLVEGTYVTKGGRVLNAVGVGASRAIARSQAYLAVDEITWMGEYHRHDIGFE